MDSLRSRFPYLMAVVWMLCWVLQVSAQVAIEPADDGFNLQTEGFPAISSDGCTILVVSNSYGCCLDLGAELIRLDACGRKAQGHLRIRQPELDRNWTAEDSLERRRWIPATNRKAQGWLEGRDWETMVPWVWQRVKDSLLDTPLVDGSRRFATWEAFQKTLPKLDLPCLDSPRRRICKVPTSIQNVWSHPDYRWILVEYGHVSAGSQSDQGPYWKVLRR